MGKASSSKKVQRAARAAGRPGTGRSWGWPLLVTGVVVIGLLLIVLSRGNTEDPIAPVLGDHWHAAYGIYDCDTFLPPLQDTIPDETGLHTHGDGLMHIHPFGTSYTGKNANLRNWGKTVGLTLTDESVKASGINRTNGQKCGDEEGIVQLKVWDSPNDDEGRLITEDLAKYNPQNSSMFTIAFAPEGADIPKPPQEALDALRAPADVVGGQQPPPTTTIPAEDGGSTTTAPAGTDSTDTTAAGTETTASTEPPTTTPTP